MLAKGVCWHGCPVPAHKPRSSTNETTKKRRDNKRQRDVEQAAASPSAPARAAHIEKPRAIRRNEDRRKTKEGEGGGLEEQDNEEDEEEYDEDGVGKKRKLEAKGWKQNKVVIHPRVSAQARVAEFPGQTFIEKHGEFMCQAYRKRLTKDKKTTLVNHCKGIHHVQAVEAFKKKETNRQVCDSCLSVLFCTVQQ